MSAAVIHYRLDNIDNLRYLLCVAYECFAETGMVPFRLELGDTVLRWNSIEARAVIKGTLDEAAYIERNRLD